MNLIPALIRNDALCMELIYELQFLLISLFLPQDAEWNGTDRKTN